MKKINLIAKQLRNKKFRNRIVKPKKGRAVLREEKININILRLYM